MSKSLKNLANIFQIKFYQETTMTTKAPLEPQTATTPISTELIEDLRSMINRTQRTIAVAVNKGLTLLYWYIGERILKETLQYKRAEYGQKIVASLLRQLSWTHFTILIPIKDPLKRDFYAEMCRIESWNYRTLQKKIASMLFERTAFIRL
jgi:hypothetical protein